MNAVLELSDIKRATYQTRYDPAELRQPGVLVALSGTADRAELARFLATKGFDVWTAASGVDALGVYFEHTGVVDVLVLDADLRDLPGLVFLRRLKAHFPGVPCVFLIDDDGRGLDLIAAGAVVVPRSIPVGELSDRVWEVVANEGLDIDCEPAAVPVAG